MSAPSYQLGVVPVSVVVQFVEPYHERRRRGRRPARPPARRARRRSTARASASCMRQRRRRAEAAAGAGASIGRAAGRDDEDVGAELVDLVLHLGLGALAEADGQDHGGDADEDAEHRERRAQPVGADRLGRGAEACRASSSGASSRCRRAASRRRRRTRPPSRISIVRSARAAMSRSWVISTIVRPSSLSSLEQLQHVGGRGRVEVAGRLVGEDHRGLGDQRARDGDPLLLTARQLARPVVGPVGRARPGRARRSARSRRSARVDAARRRAAARRCATPAR